MKEEKATIEHCPYTPQNLPSKITIPSNQLGQTTELSLGDQPNRILMGILEKKGW